MGKTVAYLRASTDKQDLSNQKLGILEFARLSGLHVGEYIEIAISSRKTSKKRRIPDGVVGKVWPPVVTTTSPMIFSGSSVTFNSGMISA